MTCPKVAHHSRRCLCRQVAYEAVVLEFLGDAAPVFGGGAVRVDGHMT